MQTIEQNKMGYKPVLPLLMSMAFPPMLSMLIQSLYNIVDSMFVAQIGEDALTAVSLAFPIQTLIVACSVGIGVGVNSYIARKLGEQNQKEANSAVAHGLLLSLIGYLLFVAIGSFTIRPFFEMFTDSAAILDDACMYTYVCVFLCFGCFFHILIEKVFPVHGKNDLPHGDTGGRSNHKHHPGSHHDFRSAGLSCNGGKGSGNRNGYRTDFRYVAITVYIPDKKIRCEAGFEAVSFLLGYHSPHSFCGDSQCLHECTGQCSCDWFKFHSDSVFQYGCFRIWDYYKLQTFVFMPASGLTQGAMPIMGYNYGAGSHERLLQTLKYAIMVTLAIMVCGCAIFLLFPTQLLMLFHASEDMLRIGVPALRIISISFLPAALGFILPTLFQAMGLGLQSLIVFLLRQLYHCPLSRLFADWFGLDGISYSFLIAESIAAGVAVLLFIRIRKKDKVLSSTFGQQPSASQSSVLKQTPWFVKIAVFSFRV